MFFFCCSQFVSRTYSHDQGLYLVEESVLPKAKPLKLGMFLINVPTCVTHRYMWITGAISQGLHKLPYRSYNSLQNEYIEVVTTAQRKHARKSKHCLSRSGLTESFKARESINPLPWSESTEAFKTREFRNGLSTSKFTEPFKARESGNSQSTSGLSESESRNRLCRPLRQDERKPLC